MNESTGIEEIKDVYAVCKEDKDIATVLLNVAVQLEKVKKELAAADTTNFPFHSAKCKEAARDVCYANLQVEVALTKLLIYLLDCKAINAEKPFTKEAFLDFHAFPVWSQHVDHLHLGHLEGIHSHLKQIIANVQGREEELTKQYEAALICPTHKKPAVARTINGKGVLCEECQKPAKKEVEEEGQKEKEE